MCCDDRAMKSSQGHTLPQIYLVRHGETEWSLSGRHTGRTDVALTERGERHAVRLRERLNDIRFVKVFTSPLRRARRTCELAGLGQQAEPDPDLMEWNYGEYEGRRTAEIQQMRPGWNLFRDGCPGGETLVQISARADRVVDRLRRATSLVAIFSHGHFLRVLTARWLALPAIEARRFFLKAAALSILGYEHDSVDEPVLVLWNDDRHVEQ